MDELTLEMNLERRDIPQDKQRKQGIREEGTCVQKQRQKWETACQGPGHKSGSKS